MKNYTGSVGMSPLNRPLLLSVHGTSIQHLIDEEPSSLSDAIDQKTDEIAAEIMAIRELHGYEFKNAWEFLCGILGIKAKTPYGESIPKAVKKLLKKAVKKAGFPHQHITEYSNSYKYAGDRYISQLKIIKDLNFYADFLFSRAEKKKLHAETCRHLTESVGMASLAQKDGLTPFFITVKLKSEYHRSSDYWIGITADESSRLLSEAFSDFYQYARNNKLKLEYIRVLEPHIDGTPHLHAIVFTDDPVKLELLLNKVFVEKHHLCEPKDVDVDVDVDEHDTGFEGNEAGFEKHGAGIYVGEVKEIYPAILYLHKNQWGDTGDDYDLGQSVDAEIEAKTETEDNSGNQYKGKKGKLSKKDKERILAWNKSISARIFSKSSNMRKLPPVALWHAFYKTGLESKYKSRFESKYEPLGSKTDANALKQLEAILYVQWRHSPGGDDCVYMHDQYYVDADEAASDTNIKLEGAANEGDYANFTRIYNAATNTRKQPPVSKYSGLKTAGSLGPREIAQITELPTIRIIMNDVGVKIRDVEDLKWVLRTKSRARNDERHRKATQFMDKFRSGQLELQLAG